MLRLKTRKLNEFLLSVNSSVFSEAITRRIFLFMLVISCVMSQLSSRLDTETMESIATPDTVSPFMDPNSVVSMTQA